MVAKINRSASLYGVLKYNLAKVSEGSAHVISGNRMPYEIGGNVENAMQQTLFAFDNYLSANKNTEKPILHISLNPSSEDKLTDKEYAALAEQYMKKMGYGDQPYVVYMHEDTGRRHIHIVSTCVREDGTKISDSYEHRRSMNVCRELEEEFRLKKIEDKKTEIVEAYLRKADYRKGDLKRQTANILKSVFTTYRFQTFGEYSALLASFNIEAKQVKGEHAGKPYTGVVYYVTDDKGKIRSQPLKSSLFGRRFGNRGINMRIKHNAKEFKEGKWSPKIREEVTLAMHGCRGKRKNFINLLKARNIDVVLRENDEGRIYGVTFVDHNTREVYNGSRLGKEFSANAFEALFNGGRKEIPPIHIPINPPAAKQGQEDSIEAAFGLFDLSPGVPDYDEEEFARLLRRKKKKKRKIQKL